MTAPSSERCCPMTAVMSHQDSEQERSWCPRHDDGEPVYDLRFTAVV